MYPGAKNRRRLGRLPPGQQLFERGGNATERGVQICAQRLHGGNDCYRDASGDEAVFNGRCT
jgi:hypothetical protein